MEKSSSFRHRIGILVKKAVLAGIATCSPQELAIDAGKLFFRYRIFMPLAANHIDDANRRRVAMKSHEHSEPAGRLAPLRELLGNLQPGSPIVLQIQREDQLRFIVLDLP